MSTCLSDAELRRLLRLLLEPDAQALVGHLERDAAQEEVRGAEGRQLHQDELAVPGAKRGELLLVLGGSGVGGKPLV